MKANKIILLLSCLSLLVACSNTDTTAFNKTGSGNKTTSIESRKDSKISSGNDAYRTLLIRKYLILLLRILILQCRKTMKMQLRMFFLLPAKN